MIYGFGNRNVAYKKEVFYKKCSSCRVLERMLYLYKKPSTASVLGFLYNIKHLPIQNKNRGTKKSRHRQQHGSPYRI